MSFVTVCLIVLDIQLQPTLQRKTPVSEVQLQSKKLLLLKYYYRHKIIIVVVTHVKVYYN